MAISTMNQESVRLSIGDINLQGDLTIPDDPKGMILFAHGSGSSRHSPRNRYVAEELQNSHLATFLLDLLTPQEESVDMYTGHLRFDISLLSDRLIAAANWLRASPEINKLNIGIFGASTGGGAALIAAAHKPDLFHAVVSRGGRPDLAAEALPYVRAATLLVVGGLDTPVIRMNEQAFQMLLCEKKLEIVAGASHLFEEPGKLEEVAKLARSWFVTHL